MSVEASFFELGGNSLRAVALARRLSVALGREVSVADVMRSPTARGARASCAGWKASTGIVAACARAARRWRASARVAARGVVEPVAAADGARGRRRDGGVQHPDAHCGSAAARRGRGAAWRVAVASVVDRHAVLRTTYEVVGDGGFAQRVRATPAATC